MDAIESSYNKGESHFRLEPLMRGNAIISDNGKDHSSLFPLSEFTGCVAKIAPFSIHCQQCFYFYL